jgi:hypothetical protein
MDAAKKMDTVGGVTRNEQGKPGRNRSPQGDAALLREENVGEKGRLAPSPRLWKQVAPPAATLLLPQSAAPIEVVPWPPIHVQLRPTEGGASVYVYMCMCVRVYVYVCACVCV